MTIKEIVKKYLIDNKYAGLINPDDGCSCKLDDLMCGGDDCSMDCEPVNEDSEQECDTCDYCGSIYNPVEGCCHEEVCKCCYCDPEHQDYNVINAAPIIVAVLNKGQVYFCSQECECNFIKEVTE